MMLSISFNGNSFFCKTEMPTPFAPTDCFTQDSFSFVKEVQEVSVSGYFMVSYNVCSVFANISLIKTVDLSVEMISDKSQSINITKPYLKKLIVFSIMKFMMKSTE